MNFTVHIIGRTSSADVVGAKQGGTVGLVIAVGVASFLAGVIVGAVVMLTTVNKSMQF